MEGVTRRCVVGIAWIWQCWYCSLFCTSGILASSDKIWINAQRNVLWKRKENDDKKGFCTKERSLALRTWNILNSSLSFWHICCSESLLNACVCVCLFFKWNKQVNKHHTSIQGRRKLSSCRVTLSQIEVRVFFMPNIVHVLQAHFRV